MNRMPAASSARKTVSPGFAFGIMLLAVAIWGTVLYRQYHVSPAQRHIDAGNAYAKRGDGIDALREWRAASQLEPGNAFAWQLQGQSYFEAGLWQPAREALLRVERISPNTPHVASLLASCCHHLNDLDDSLNYAREALKRDPDDVPAMEVYVAALTQRQGDTREIAKYLRRLTELKPDVPEHYVALAQILIGQNDVADVLPILDRILQLLPDSAEMYALRGTARFNIDGSPDGLQRAEDDLNRALALRPGIYTCYLYLGKICQRRGQWAKSVAFLEEAVRQNPKKPDAYFDLATVYTLWRQPGKAAVARRKFQEIALAKERYIHLKKRCDLAPDDFDLNLEVARMAIQQEDLSEAQYCIGRAERLRPGDAQIQSARQQIALLDAKNGAAPSARIQAGAAPYSPVSGGPQIH